MALAWPPLSLSHAALPGPTARYGNSGAPASVFRRGVSRTPAARATASALLCTRNGTHPPMPHVTQHIMTKGLSPPGVLSPPRPLTARCPSCQPLHLSLSSALSHPQLCGIPPVTPQACAGPPVTARAFTTQHHLLSPPGPVVALPTALGPSPPNVLLSLIHI